MTRLTRRDWNVGCKAVWITEPDRIEAELIDLSVYSDCFVLLHGLFCPYRVYHKLCALCKTDYFLVRC